MGRILTFILILLVSSQTVVSQKCGTQPYKDPWLTDFQKRMPSLNLRSADDTLLLVPITLHVVGDDKGQGYFPSGRLMAALCRLNQDFEPTNIQFYLAGEIRYINNSNYFSHDDIHGGAQMMFEHNVDHTINCYVVQDPAGNCGYNLPYAGIALSKSCMSPTDHTWAHEVGHNLSLPHPFLGWEGGQTHDGSNPPVFGKPAPNFVTYDYTFFKQVYYQDTLIIDTALVERMDGSNCREAADGFCDTKPDYIASRWPCNSDSFSTVRQLDPDSVSFQSDGRWIMSYSSDECNKGFSPEQIMAMRGNLREEKPTLLSNQTPGFVIDEQVELQTPSDESDVPSDRVLLSWTDVGPANYIVQVSRLNTFGLLVVDTIVNGNSLMVSNLSAGRKYYWRVQPFSSHDFCTEQSTAYSFTVTEPTSTEKTTPPSVAIHQIDSYLKLKFGSTVSIGDLDIEIKSISGQMVKRVSSHSKTNELLIDVSSFSSGVYFIRIHQDEEILTFKTFIF